MPIIKSAIKRVKQANVRRERNVATKRAIKAAVKAFEAKPSAATLSKAQSELDKAVKKNLLHKNTVARRKANLSKTAKAANVKLASGASAKPAAAKKPVASKKPAATKTTTAKKPTVKKAPAKKPATKKPAAK